MGDFATEANVADAGALGYGGVCPFNRGSMTTVAGFWYSGWMSTGSPAPGVAPSAAATPTMDTVGALGRWNPNSTGTNRLLYMLVSSGNAGSQMPIMMDRLAHMGGLSTNVITAQTVNLDLVTASGAGRCDANGVNVDWFIEVFSAGGATSSVNVVVTYTNESGTGSRTATITLAASGWPAGRMYRINDVLQAGDSWIKSVQSITVNTASGTAGNIGVVAGRRLSMSSWASAGQATDPAFFQGGGFGQDHYRTGMPKIPNGVCLWPIIFSNSSSWALNGYVRIGGVA